MKTNLNIFFILLASVAVVSCQKTRLISTTRRPVQFQAVSDGASTRTSFSGFVSTENDPSFYDFTESSIPGDEGFNLMYAIERIDWEEGDKFEVYCPESESSAVYTVSNPLNDGAYCVADAVSSSPLFWEGDGHHTFYAFYPAPEPVSDPMTTMVGTSVSASIPAEQVLKQEGRRFYAEMDKYGYMYAVTSTLPDNTYDRVTLDFKPLMSCIEVVLIAREDDESKWPTVTRVELVSDQENAFLAGHFTTTLKPDGSYEALRKSDISNGRNSVSFDLPDGGVILSCTTSSDDFFNPYSTWTNTTTNRSATTFAFLVLPMEQTNLKLRLTLDSGKVISTEIKKHQFIRKTNEQHDEEWTDVVDQGYLTIPAGSKFWIACEVPYFE